MSAGDPNPGPHTYTQALSPLSHLPDPYFNVFLDRINLVCPKIPVRIAGCSWYQQVNFPPLYVKKSKIDQARLNHVAGKYQWTALAVCFSFSRSLALDTKFCLLYQLIRTHSVPRTVFGI